MQQTTLVVMAAGMGSRYGGLKQIDPVGPNNELIIDYSIYDAIEAGFNDVVFIIKKEIEKDFREVIGNRIEKIINVNYAFQSIQDLPKGFSLPINRQKPWGTAHAVMSCRKIVNTPFAVINADDFYGRKSFSAVHDYLVSIQPNENVFDYCMVGFILENTLTENGHVARGVCKVTEDGFLREINERKTIRRFGNLSKYTEDGENWIEIPNISVVSMNKWGFTPSIFNEIEQCFPKFLEESKNNILKEEFFLPSVVDSLIQEKKARVKVLSCNERWYGVTYKDDKSIVQGAIASMIKSGIYSDKLWEELSSCKI